MTHFLNGLDAGCEGEGCCLPTVADDEIARQPAMSTAQITDALVQAIADPQRRAIVANFANLDQVGHLGRLELAEQAATAVDLAFRRLVDAAQQHDVSLLVTADHGNAEVMQGEDGSPFGSHTGEPVPFLTVPPRGVQLAWAQREGSLANVAATFLDALGEAPPDWMQPALARFARR